MSKHIVNSVRYFYVLSVVFLPVLVAGESTLRPVVPTANATEYTNVNTTVSVTNLTNVTSLSGSEATTSNKIEITTVSETEPVATSAVDLTANRSTTKLPEQESTEVPTSDLQSTKASTTELEMSTNEQDQEKSTVAEDFTSDTSEPDQGISTVTEATTSDELTTVKEDSTTSKSTSVESEIISTTEPQTDASIDSVRTGTEGVVDRTVTSSDRMVTTFVPEPSGSEAVMTTEVDITTDSDVDDGTESYVFMTTKASVITDSVTTGTEEVTDRIVTSFPGPTMTTQTDGQTTESVIMSTSTYLQSDLSSDRMVTTFGPEPTGSDVMTTEADITTDSDVDGVTDSKVTTTTEASVITDSVTTGTEEVTDGIVTSFLGTTMTTQMAGQTTESVVMPTSTTYLPRDLPSDRMVTTFGPEPSGSDVMTTEVDITTDSDVDDVTKVATTEASMITDSVTTSTEEVTDRIVTSFLGTTMTTQTDSDVFVTTDMSITTESDSDALTSFIGKTTEPSVVMTTDDYDDSTSSVGITTSSGTSTTQKTLPTRDDGGIESHSVMTTALPVDMTTSISTSKPDVRMTSEPPIVSIIPPENATESDTLTPTSVNLPTGPTSTSSVTSSSAAEHVTQSEERTTQHQKTNTQTPIQSTTRKPATVIHPDTLNEDDKLYSVVNAEIKSITKQEWPEKDFKFREFVASLNIETPTRKRRQATNISSKITAEDVIYVQAQQIGDVIYVPKQIGNDLEIQFVVESGSSYVPGRTLTEQLHKTRERMKSEVGIVLGAMSVGISVEKSKPGENSSSDKNNNGVFLAVITIACVSLVMLSAGFVYIVCNRRRARRGEYITDNTSEVDGGYDNPIMNEKKGTNGNGANLLSIKVDTAMVPMEEQANGDKGKFEVEDTHL